MPIVKLSGKRPDNLGADGGQLRRCPSAPKCVSSQQQGKHGIAPLDTQGQGVAAFNALAELIDGLDNTTLVTRRDDYLHAEFSTPTLGFVDDVECLLSSDGSRIDVRSCSRLGYSDWGVNRKRVEMLRDRLNAALT